MKLPEASPSVKAKADQILAATNSREGYGIVGVSVMDNLLSVVKQTNYTWWLLLNRM